MSIRLKPDYFDQRGDCAVPVGIADLCRRTGSCGHEVDLQELNLAEWNQFLLDETAPESYTGDELEALMDAQEAIESAWQEMRWRTCDRFRPGECLVVRLCEPECLRNYCDPCGATWQLNLHELLTHVDFREVTNARMFEYAEGGLLTVHEVDLPGALPKVGNSWRLDGEGSANLTLSPQRANKTTDIPELPEQDMSIVFGGECTSALVLTARNDIPPIVRRAVVDLVNDYLDDCHSNVCGKVNDRVKTASNDGKTLVLNDPDVERPQKSVQLSETLYGCKRHGQFWRHDIPDAVRDMRWVCCDVFNV